MSDVFIENFNKAFINAETAEETKFMLKFISDINVTDSFGNTALIKAKTPEQTKLLIEASAANGADVLAYINAKNNLGNTALHVSVGLEQTRILIDSGANLYINNNNGTMPLDYNNPERWYDKPTVNLEELKTPVQDDISKINLEELKTFILKQIQEEFVKINNKLDKLFFSLNEQKYWH